MPSIAKEPGDIFYPQYVVMTTEPCDGGVTFVKGGLYTKNSDGNLVAPTAGFANGLYQSTRGFTSSSTDGDDTVQVQGRGSRVALKAKTAGMYPGQRVAYDSGSTVKVWAPATAGTLIDSDYNNIVGHIYKIYSWTDISEEKKTTAADDIVVVNLE